MVISQLIRAAVLIENIRESAKEQIAAAKDDAEVNAVAPDWSALP